MPHVRNSSRAELQLSLSGQAYSMKRVLGDSLTTYPDWVGRTILWWATGSGKPLNIHLGRVSAWTKTFAQIWPH